MNKFLLTIISIFMFCANAYAYTLDTSVDEQIKQQYTNYEISEDIKKTAPKDGLNYTQQSQPNIINNSTAEKTTTDKNNIKLPAGTKFCLKNNQKITDSLNVGVNLTFVSCAPLVKKNITIPSGTNFSGIITEKHSGQIAGNGALVGIKITKMTYNQKDYPINAKVTKLNSDNIFFNNIKGERTYIKGVQNRVNKGKAFYQKTKQTSVDWSKKPVVKIVSPLPKVVGAVGSALTTISSPFVAITTKGGNVSIDSGSIFEVKLLDSVYIDK